MERNASLLEYVFIVIRRAREMRLKISALLLQKQPPVGLKPRHRSFKTNEVFLLKEIIYLYVAVYLCFTIYDFRFSLIPLFTRVITIKNDEIFILMIQSILHLILIIVIVSLSIIKPLTSGLCLMVILVCLYLEWRWWRIWQS